MHAVESPDELLVVNAAEALAAHHRFEWADELDRRLPNIKDQSAKIQIAGILAKAGHYNGWEIVRTTIITKQRYQNVFDDAIAAVPNFAGMKNANGEPVNLAEELDNMNT